MRAWIPIGARACLAAVAAIAVSMAAGCGDEFSKAEEGDVSAIDGGDGAAAGDDVGSGDTDAGKRGPADTHVSPKACKDDADCTGAPACTAGRCLKSADGSFCAFVQLNDGAACADDDPCTIDTRCEKGKCVNKGADGCGCTEDEDCLQFDDEDYCNGFYTCDTSQSPGRCVMEADSFITCGEDSKDPCNPIVCYPSVGDCKPAPAQDGQKCDDGDACLEDDRCVGGKCAGQVAVCPCKTNSDCAAIDNDDPCDGTLFCDTSAFPSACKISPASKVECSAINDTECATNQCDKKTAKCAMTPKKDTTACEDGDACTSGDGCYDGECVPGTQVCPCAKTADCAKFEDGDACNGTLFCDVKKDTPSCVVNPATVVSCGESEDPCLVTGCDKKAGTCGESPAPKNTLCDDFNTCTAGDHCADGKCLTSANTCSCITDADCADKSTNKCLGPMFCDKSGKSFKCAFNPAKLVVCDTSKDTTCAANKCDKKEGVCKMTPATDGKACDADGNPCTSGDVCDQGKCAVGTNICQCEANADCSQFEDGNACNGTLFCNTTKLPLLCEVNPATKVSCPTANDTACKENRCDKKTGGCKPTPTNENGPCDADGDSCTANDQCVGGACQVGTNTCSCNVDADCAKSEDGDACNGTLFCDKTGGAGTCKLNPSTVVKCSQPSGEPCKESVCEKASGKCAVVERKDGEGCNDGVPCTAGESCEGGKCVLGTKATNVCGCLKDDDCEDTPAAKKSKCDEALICDKSGAIWSCQKLPGTQVQCPGNLPCVTLKCEDTTGLCVKDSVKGDGQACDDDDECTDKTTCKAGVCAGGAPKVCEDNNKCTANLCDPQAGCDYPPLALPGCPTPSSSGNSQ